MAGLIHEHLMSRTLWGHTSGQRCYHNDYLYSKGYRNTELQAVVYELWKCRQTISSPMLLQAIENSFMMDVDSSY